MLANLLVFDMGSTYTKLAAFALLNGKLHYLGNGKAPTTLEDVSIGTNGALKALKEKGIEIEPDAKMYSSCSAAGGLRMVALGFMPNVTVKAAREVSMTAGARVMQVISADEPLDYRRDVLREINPDIILLSGGTDGGDEKNVLENTDMICDLKPNATVIVGCNRFAQGEVVERLKKAGISYVRVPNIMPTIHELRVAPAREAIHEQFIKQITRAKGLMEFRESLADKTVVPTPGAVLLASELLAKGSYEDDGVGSLILIDVGGATTDIHSAIPALEKLSIEDRGLVINNEKQFSYRTVEGNLGMRVSATGVPDAVGPKAVLRAVKGDYGLTPEDVLEYTEMLERETNHIPQNEKEEALDLALAQCAVHVALRRHAGAYIQQEDKVLGIMAGMAVGRDLRLVDKVICVGGIFVHNKKEDVLEIIENCFKEPGISLLPIEMPQIVIDSDYYLYALGVLGKYYPDEVLEFMKENFNMQTEKKELITQEPVYYCGHDPHHGDMGHN